MSTRAVSKLTKGYPACNIFKKFKLDYLPFYNLDRNYIPSCTSSDGVLQLCQVLCNSIQLIRRSCAYKIHGQTDGQGDSYISQTLFAGGITR